VGYNSADWQLNAHRPIPLLLSVQASVAFQPVSSDGQPSGVQPTRRTILDAFFRLFFSPRMHKWQNWHWTPLWQPLNAKAQGLHVPAKCPDDPTVGIRGDPSKCSAATVEAAR
jgi:hypothetical protein